jgi:hypothetical protein
MNEQEPNGNQSESMESAKEYAALGDAAETQVEPVVETGDEAWVPLEPNPDEDPKYL